MGQRSSRLRTIFLRSWAGRPHGPAVESAKLLNPDPLLARMDAGEVYRLEELVESTGTAPSKLLPRLMDLELQGYVVASGRRSRFTRPPADGDKVREGLWQRHWSWWSRRRRRRPSTNISGRNYKVIASMGHVRDLPKSKLGVDIDEGFEPSYEVIASRKKVLKELKDAAKEADRRSSSRPTRIAKARPSAGTWRRSSAAATGRRSAA